MNCETGELVERDLTPEELSLKEQARLEAEQIAQQETEALATRQSALAKLQALGLTEEEVQSLLG